MAQTPKLRFRTLPFLLTAVAVLAVSVAALSYYFGSSYGLNLSPVEFLLVGGLLVSTLVGAIYWWLRINLLLPLEQMYQSLRALARGKPTVLELHESSQNDIVRMMRVVNQLSAGLHRIAVFAKRVGEGELSVPFQPLSESDELGNALLLMRENLKQGVVIEQQRNWQQTGMAQLSVKLNATDDVQANVQAAVEDLVHYMGVLQIGVFVIESPTDRAGEEGPVMLSRLAWSGIALPSTSSQRVPPTALHDRVLTTGKSTTIAELPAGFLRVETGLGQASARELFIAPLRTASGVLGVMEVASFRSLLEHERQFVEQLCGLFGGVIYVGLAGRRTRELLERSEELNRSLESQREDLHKSLERLVATQQEMKFAQRQLQEAAELNNKLYEEAQFGMGISDGYILTDCNRALVELLGVGGKEKVVGRTLIEFSTDDQPDLRKSDVVLREHVEQVMTRGRHSFEWQFARGGASWYAEVNLLKLSGTGRQTVVYQVRDITERKRTELEMRQMNAMLIEREEELWKNIVQLTEAQQAKSRAETQLSEKDKLLQQISNNAPALLFRFESNRANRESKFLFASGAAERLSGYSAEKWLTFSFDDFLELLHPSDRDEVRLRARHSAEHLTPFTAEGRLQASTGDYKWVRIVSNPTPITKSKIVSDGVITDVSEIKQLIFEIEEKNTELRSQEEELRQNAEELLSVNEELERRNFELQQSQQELNIAVEKLKISEADLEEKVVLRTEELQRAKEEADRANQVKSLFLANMSHELRTPLNGILGYAQILHDAPTMPEPLRDKISIIHRSGEHLLSLINEVLDLSKIEAGKMELVPRRFSLPAFLRELREMFMLRAQTKGLSLEFLVSEDIPQTVVADELKLRQCLVNLLSNAIKFTPKGGVKLEVYRQRDARIRFAVVDTGRGIPPERIPDIVKPFKQLASDFTTEGGTGLGLAITKSYLEMMGGRLLITSEVNKGSTFAFAIHLEELDATSALMSLDSEQEPGATRVVGYTAERPIKILVVDDNEINREVAIELLRNVGFEVDFAVDGQHAIDKFKAYRPDLIIMDVRMPGLNGLEATEQIRKLKGGKEVKICAVTASVFEGERKTIYKHGCDDYLPKPYKVTELLSMIRRHLSVQYQYEAVTLPESPSAVEVELDYPYLAKHLPRGYLNQLSELLELGDYIEATRRTDAIRKDDPQVQDFKRLVIFLLNELRVEQLDVIVNQLKEPVR